MRHAAVQREVARLEQREQQLKAGQLPTTADAFTAWMAGSGVQVSSERLHMLLKNLQPIKPFMLESRAAATSCRCVHCLDGRERSAGKHRVLQALHLLFEHMANMNTNGLLGCTLCSKPHVFASIKHLLKFQCCCRAAGA
jgi:hypothetical protein